MPENQPVEAEVPELLCLESDEEAKDFKEVKKLLSVQRRYRKCPVPGGLSKPQKRLANHLTP